MQWIKLDLELLTPAFLAGANQKQVQLRGASIKGLLRWWWRAAEGHQAKTLAQLREWEGELFGSAEFRRKSPITVFLRPSGPLPYWDYGPTFACSGRSVQSGRHSVDGLHYLAYGPFSPLPKEEKNSMGQALDPKFNDPKTKKAYHGPILRRPALAPGAKFQLEVTMACLGNKQQEKFLRGLSAFLAFGGIGCRSRKGFGALQWQGLEASSEDLKEQVADFLRRHIAQWQQNGKPFPSPLPLWPQLEYRHILAQTGKFYRWEEALGELAVLYKACKRSQPPWLFGSASPRRASSVLLTVRQNQQGYYGLMVALPCSRCGGSPSQERDAHAWQKLLQAPAASATPPSFPNPRKTPP